MSSGIRIGIVVVGLMLVALAVMGIDSTQGQHVIRTAASAVWGS